MRSTNGGRFRIRCLEKRWSMKKSIQLKALQSVLYTDTCGRGWCYNRNDHVGQAGKDKGGGYNRRR
ncbi:hypothetical protein HanOQP8_Chr09g0332951 [Helianthus annuus]|nr:hypothetical protein HanLR1_Chr09g0328161 [Helianthus annuus]KAJ0712263.1 hypothetical protein HanOQP8_Chr09g0332951 [Helianthus annuus]